MRALGLTLLAIGLASMAFLPIVQDASADHVYTHRYLVQGRVVDTAGAPVSQANVHIQLDGWLVRDEGVEGLCREGGAQRVAEDAWITRTNAFGDYSICLHAHQLIDTGQVVITVGNTTVNVDKDIDTRTSFKHITIEEGAAGQPGDVGQFSSLVMVRGRIWQPLAEAQRIEGNPATGTTPTALKINVTLELADGTTVSQETSPNQWGDFGVQLSTQDDLEGAQVILKAGPGTEAYTDTVDIDPTFRAVDHKFVIDHELETSNSPGFGLLAALLAGAGALGLTGLRRRA